MRKEKNLGRYSSIFLGPYGLGEGGGFLRHASCASWTACAMSFPRSSP